MRVPWTMLKMRRPHDCRSAAQGDMCNSIYVLCCQ